jgi:hypothetical protein|uniref:Uncharacterized protein n=1 Tax=Myoviridae sp. ct5xZ3 TaxID=2827601 RepID=A0A8S5RSA4_9CAUD|nr:MAG TPA: hypothetical protein [Myoviridae sp. ct5xZ3]
MQLLKRPHLLRRYSKPKNVRGYISIPYSDLTLPMDVQTLENKATTTPDGTKSVQRLKVFCDDEILIENEAKQQKADRLWFQNKWFECDSSRLSENTPLRHYTATFVECLEQEAEPGAGNPGKEEETTDNEHGGS